jgi:hypothetical protein
MPEKHPDADRWGGPGASHENRDKPKPDPLVKDPDAPDHLSPRAQVSGGGGERDIHNRHNAEAKKIRQASSEEKAHELDGRRPR